MDDNGSTTEATAGARAGVSSRPTGSPGPVGWYPDPWSINKRRYWTGDAWTAWTTDATDTAQNPPPLSPTPPTQPFPAPPPASTTPTATYFPPPVPPPATHTGAPDDKSWSKRTMVLVVVIGLIVGAAAAFILHGSPSSNSNTATGQLPSSGNTNNGNSNQSPFGGNTQNTAPVSRDPQASALTKLGLQQSDVNSSIIVALITDGNTLNTPTLDLCNGTFPSESQRTARLQVAGIDSQGNGTLSTEAVLYANPGAATQAFSELQKVASSCPSTPVTSPVGEPTVTTHFNAAPDANWPQTATVNRLAYDFTSTDDTGQVTHSIAVYLERGRVLVGVYFPDADTPPATVAGQSTVQGIVGVFASRIAALPSSVTG